MLVNCYRYCCLVVFGLDRIKQKEGLLNALLESGPLSTDVANDMCFVSTDIESSTVLRVHSLEAYDEATQVHHNLLRQTLQAHRGVELLCEGDGFILGFASVAAGVAFCCEFQQALQNYLFVRSLSSLDS